MVFNSVSLLPIMATQEKSSSSFSPKTKIECTDDPISMKRAKKANKLGVEEVLTEDDDNSCITMHPLTMEQLDIFYGDTVLLNGKEGRDTICIAYPDKTCEASKIRMNEVVRSNLDVEVGDMVSVYLVSDVMNGDKVHIVPLDDGITGSLIDDYLKPYFDGMYRPVREGDVFLVSEGEKTVKFKVIETDPAEYCIVMDDTEIVCEGKAMKT